MLAYKHMQNKKLKTVIINKESKGYLAKLLATENISIQHKKVQTASFDVKNRTLTLPIWKNMGNDVIDLLISHEVGHALFTPEDGWRKAIDKGIQHSFLNVIEDARIEKLIKRKYPGLKQSFIKGYIELINNNFFGTKEKDVNNMLLIDRLNIHFKSSIVGSTVKFTNKKELDIVKRMDNLETWEDVVKLAEELGGYCKSEMKSKGIDQLQVGDTDEDSEEYDSDQMREQEGNQEGNNAKENEQEENQDEENSEKDTTSSESDTDKKEKESLGQNAGHQSQSQEQGWDSEEEPVAETDTSWESQKGNLLDKSGRENQYFNMHEFNNYKEFVVDYKQVLKDFKKYHSAFFYGVNHTTKEIYENKDRTNAWAKVIADYKLFKRDSQKQVNYMVKEFEMKKAATAYRRAQTSNSGVVDPLKLHSYKFNNDIFKRLTTTPDGKNHGLVMYIDWSGSMSDKLFDTIKQLMNLTMFCKKINVPFEVYAFNNGRWESSERKLPTAKYQDNDITIDTSLRMLNFISSKMTAKEYEQGMTNLYALGKCKEGRNYNYYSRRQWANMTQEEIESREWTNHLPDSPRGYGLSSTPLNDCIMASIKMVKDFQLQYNIDKMITVFLTDGSSDGNERIVKLHPTKEEKRNGYPEGSYYVDSLDYDTNHIMVDKATKHQYMISGGRRRLSLTDSLLQALKDRTGTKLLGFYIQRGRRLDRFMLDQYFPYQNYFDTEKGRKYYDRNQINSQFRKQKFLCATDNTGYDEYYLISGDTIRITDGQMATPSDNAKKGEIKKLFSQNLKSNRHSRVIMNKFISQVA